MPWSETARRPWVAYQLGALNHGVPVRKVVDVGTGAGTWHTFFAPSWPGAHWTAVEIYEPYVARFGLADRYDEIVTADVRDLDPFPPADVVIFGDVMEHMPAADAVKVWKRARQVARWLILALPVKPYPQGEVEGNPHEAHLHDWDTRSVLDSFPGIVTHAGPPPIPPGQTAGAFIAAGLVP